jgi:hypothetical protein
MMKFPTEFTTLKFVFAVVQTKRNEFPCCVATIDPVAPAVVVCAPNRITCPAFCARVNSPVEEEASVISKRAPATTVIGRVHVWAAALVRI